MLKWSPLVIIIIIIIITTVHEQTRVTLSQ